VVKEFNSIRNGFPGIWLKGLENEPVGFPLIEI